MSSMAARLVSELTERGETLSFCESLTAGLASATVASVPGASAVLRGGLVTYATEVKSHFLHQPVADIEAAGVVSGETLSLIHISEPTRLHKVSRMPSSA